jgi:hypothetical protein
MARIDHPLVVYFLVIGKVYDQKIKHALVAKIRSASNVGKAVEVFERFLLQEGANRAVIHQMMRDKGTIKIIKECWAAMEYFGIQYPPLPDELKEYFGEEDADGEKSD